MSMHAKDIAQMLQLSERTVRRWVREGKIPAFQLHRQYWFDRLELQDWMLKSINMRAERQLFAQSDAVPNGKLSPREHLLYRALSKGGVYSQIPGESKKEVITKATDLIAEKLNADAEVLTEMLLDRESLNSTGILNGIAVPHTRDYLLPKPTDCVAVVYLERPIPYDALDGLPVHTLLFVFACENWRHLQLLAKIALLCQQPAFQQLLQDRADVHELLTYVKSRENGRSSHLPKAPRLNREIKKWQEVGSAIIAQSR